MNLKTIEFLKTISYKLLGLAIIIAGYFFARLTGVGEFLLFAVVIGLAAMVHREPAKTNKKRGIV